MSASYKILDNNDAKKDFIFVIKWFFTSEIKIIIKNFFNDI